MNSLERIKTTLQQKQPDRIPFRMHIVPELEAPFSEKFCGGQSRLSFFEDDLQHTYLKNEFVFPPTYDGITCDTLPLPDEDAFTDMKKQVDEIHAKGKAAFNSYTPGVYETIIGLIGVETALMDMYGDPEGLEEKIEKVTQWEIELVNRKVAAGIDILLIGDDLGTQRSLIMSPESYHRFYKPRHKQIISAAKKANPEIKIAFHCCGHVMPLIPDLIEVGIDILETLQPEAENDRAFIKKEYGHDLCFWGGIGMQSVFWRKKPEYVIEKVREAIELLGDGGGYICAPCHVATPDIHIDNIKAFYDAVQCYGYYR